MLRPLYLDLETGRYIARDIQSLAVPSVYDFDVTADEGETLFSLTPGVLTSESYVEVKINGREAREGSGHDFERDVLNDRISFSESIPKSAWVRIKIYPLAGA